MAIILSTSMCFSQNDIPSSPRSREAINRVTQGLEKEVANKKLRYGSPIFIRIFKEEMELEVWIKEDSDNFIFFKSYSICTYGSGGLGPKTMQGDGKAPEGFYYVLPNRLNPLSDFHLSFNLGYPNRYDRYHKRTGGALMVHGSCVSIGCYAMTNSSIEEIYALADAAFRNGQRFFRVHIFPFKMEDENMVKHNKSEWYSFWENLKEGYDYFENNDNMPPNVEVVNGRYVFNSP
ncbi:murein L,D-transpeptidase [bacterium]|nr:murein L,D-transpeptidase [bacterium]